MNRNGASGSSRQSHGRFLLAFAAVYVVWGSTYLAIQIAVESMPPLLLMGARSILAGGVLYAWARHREGARPLPGQWRTSLLVGGLFFLCGHGGLAWAETRVPSGTAALVIATMPIWTVMLGGRETGSRLRLFAAMILGIAGVTFLTGPASILGGGAVDPAATLVLVLAALSWAIGSVVSRRVARPASTALVTGMDLLAGGALLGVASLIRGEPASVGRGSLSLPVVTSLLYLVVFGSVLTLTAYNWLLRNTTLARASSYVYVNPIIALVIGWAFDGETLTPRVAIAAAILVLAVFLIMTAPAARRGAPARDPLETAPCRT